MSRPVDRSSKGARTRQRIVERASELFNTRGVAGASMADISEATGLEKGGVYNHFTSKDDLAIAAFEYGADVVLGRIDAAMAGATTPLGKLRAVVEFYRHADRSFVRGGCPLMNSAIEADSTNPEMRKRVARKFDYWRASFVAAIEDAIEAGELRSVDARSAATVFLAMIEGAIMLSMLYRSRDPLVAVADHLDAHLDSLMPSAASRRT